MNRNRSTPALVIGLLLLAVIAACLAVSGCMSTVAPKPVVDRQASFDGNTQNSGLVSILTNGCAIVTPHWRDRYNAFIVRYGASYQIKSSDYGLTPYTNGTWLANKQSRSYFAIWNLQSKSK